MNIKKSEQSEQKRFTRSTKQAAETNINKSAIIDHVRRENHIIDWEESIVVAKEVTVSLEKFGRPRSSGKPETGP